MNNPTPNFALPRRPVGSRPCFAPFAAATVLFLAVCGGRGGADESGEKAAAKGEASEAATRLQVFLDRQQFTPGKIDGRYGEFTRRALKLFRESKGMAGVPGAETTAERRSEKTDGSPSANGGADVGTDDEAAPDLTGLDLSSADPPIISHVVTEADLKHVGDLPKAVPDQAKVKALPYASAAEALAEKFHCDIDYFRELNGENTEGIKAGDTVQVPNVEPFDLDAVMAAAKEAEAEEEANQKDGSAGGSEEAAARKTGKDGAKSEDGPKAAVADAKEEKPRNSIRIDTSTNTLELREEDRLIAAYPVTIGSDQTSSPIGEWEILSITPMPFFRYDRKMLNEGERSDDFHVLPPGPNNPVGVMWIALNKKGIGIHGTSEPDTIGRSSSHGCIRLANWDVVRFAEKVAPGTPVVIGER